MKYLNSGMLIGLLASFPVSAAGIDDLAKARAQVSYIYKRLTGVPPLVAEAEAFATKLATTSDKVAVMREIAEAAVANDNFYSRTVLDFAQPESNEARELNDDPGTLSDLTATIIGFIKDGKDYRQILSGDIMYIPVGTTYNPDNNAAYDALYNNVKAGKAQLASSLVEVPQSTANPSGFYAGILSLRGFASVYYDDGTNRAPVRFTYLNYACRDMEDVSDVTRSDIYVRRDVDRAPGGDPSKYRSECVGCHAGMDAQAKAFANVNFVLGQQAGSGRLQFANAPVQKVNRNNDTFPAGAVVNDDAWLNLWIDGTNASLGWDESKISGKGPKSWGEMMASTKMFPECMAKRVYKVVCLKDSRTNADKAVIDALSENFVNGGFNMKDLFKDAAIECAQNLSMPE